MLSDGTNINDRCTVERQLGVGGSAIVYRAHDRLLDRSVTLKLLNDFVSDADRTRFEREIRLTQDAFVDRGSSRQLSDRITMTAGELGQWTLAMDWVECGYLERPGRLIRVLTDLPFDRSGLA